MKVNKPLAIIQLSLMYISLICLFVAALMVNSEDTEAAITALFIVGVVAISLANALAIAILIIAFVSIFKRNTINSTKFVMIYKIVSIPWFIGNFVFCVLLIAAMLNPFLLIAIPVLVTLLSFSTYICMIPTSMMNVGYVLSSLRRKSLKPNALIFVGLILGFIFCADLIGSIFVYSELLGN